MSARKIDPRPVVPVLQAWQAGLGVSAWCPADRRWHYFEGPWDDLGGGFRDAPTCRASTARIVKVELQPGLPPHKGRRGRWLRREGTALVKGGTEPELLGEVPLPLELCEGVTARPESVCPTCSEPTLECRDCGDPCCEACDEGLCPRCGTSLPTAEVLEREAIHAFEAEPLDPDDDLSVLRGYPTLRAEYAAEQAAIRAEVGYRVACKAGPTWREAYLVARAEGTSEEFLDRLCECEPFGETFDDGRPVYSWHRKANRCRWCQLYEALAEQEWQELRTASEREHRAYLAALEVSRCA